MFQDHLEYSFGLLPMVCSKSFKATECSGDEHLSERMVVKTVTEDRAYLLYSAFIWLKTFSWKFCYQVNCSYLGNLY